MHRNKFEIGLNYSNTTRYEFLNVYAIISFFHEFHDGQYNFGELHYFFCSNNRIIDYQKTVVCG